MAARHVGQIECKRSRCHLRHGAHASRILSDHHASNSLMTRTCRVIISGCESEQVAHCGVHAPRTPPTWAECNILSYRGGCVGRSRPSGCKALSLLYPCSIPALSKNTRAPAVPPSGPLGQCSLPPLASLSINL
jgi:hypothetical protein